MRDDARRILERLAGAGRNVWALKPEERRLVVAILISAVVPADRKVREVEIDRLVALADEKCKLSRPTLETVVGIAESKTFSVAELQQISALVPHMLNVESRCQLVGMLWEIAHCDNELHALEEELITFIANKLDVPRKMVVEQQLRAAARVGI